MFRLGYIILNVSFSNHWSIIEYGSSCIIKYKWEKILGNFVQNIAATVKIFILFFCSCDDKTFCKNYFLIIIFTGFDSQL